MLIAGRRCVGLVGSLQVVFLSDSGSDCNE